MPEASPSLNILVFKMGIATLVFQRCWESWLAVGPTVNTTLPLTKCQLFILRLGDDLRGWHTNGIDIHIGIWQERKEILIGFIPSPLLTVFI